jgi:uncharacterized protein (TIGR02996 family)
MSHSAFLNTISEHPADDTARLVYADWLDEQGGEANAARAEFIRTQVLLAQLGEADPLRAALEDRENELLRTHEAAWIGEVATGLTGWKFERGFLTELSGPIQVFVESGIGRMFDRHPISRLRIAQSSTATGPISRLLPARWLVRIRELIIDNLHLTRNGIGRLFKSERLAGVTRLELNRVSLSDKAEDLPGVLAKSPAFAGAKRFRVTNWSGAGEDLVKVLTGSNIEELSLESVSADRTELLTSKFATRLKRLELAALNREHWGSLQHRRAKPVITHLGLTSLNEDGLDLCPVVSASACANLRALDLNESRVRADALRKLSESDFWVRCRELKIIRGKCPPETMAVLARRSGPAELRVLKLGETGLRDEGVRRLCSAPWTHSLVELDLMRNYLSDSACRAIRDEGQFHNLRHLDIRTNGPKLGPGTKERITDKGLAALAKAKCLSNLRHLNLHSLPITAAGVDTIINTPNWKLAELDVGGTEIGAAGIKVLARSPNISRLTRLNLSFITGLNANDLMPLAESPYLSPICEVSGLYYRLSDRVKSAFAERLGKRFKV